ncbi:hypothetical protein PACTADRAFT_49858 [Pachysolen tannophilus NRRL Y-2460]|uniref:ATP synthase subunit delta, mitochondrial n=1 Tax=Pachysolen tannophilus NRRL Y-2460 TaxID=669874 RepID=A0A1E4TTN1_PACTA|nr:hypothetical protein PACTADRAFT_49858 [Pachysolen tannophilus NRRL Y-2460]
MFRQSLRTVSRSARLVQRRTYAEAVSNPDILKVSLALPHETLVNAQEVTQVNIPAVSGEMGILANHVPVVEQLKPGIVEIIESSGTTKQFFVNGGFATVQPDSKLNITAIEAFTPDSFSPEAIKSQLTEAQKNLSSADEAVAAEAAIEVEVLEALAAVAK